LRLSIGKRKQHCGKKKEFLHGFGFEYCLKSALRIYDRFCKLNGYRK
jgi:hypothetical protein